VEVTRQVSNEADDGNGSSGAELLSLEVPQISMQNGEGKVGVTWSSGIESKL
jgi:hypothetical protein